MALLTVRCHIAGHRKFSGDWSFKAQILHYAAEKQISPESREATEWELSNTPAAGNIALRYWLSYNIRLQGRETYRLTKRLFPAQFFTLWKKYLPQEVALLNIYTREKKGGGYVWN